MPERTIELTALSDAHLKSVAKTYEDIATSIASERRGRHGSTTKVRFGPTAAAKILFAFWPNALPPWDSKIQKEFGYDGSAASYCRFLVERVRPDISELVKDAERFGISPEALPARIDRGNSTLVKLADEYYYMKTRGGTPPTQENVRENIRLWARWAEIICERK